MAGWFRYSFFRSPHFGRWLLSTGLVSLTVQAGWAQPVQFTDPQLLVPLKSIQSPASMPETLEIRQEPPAIESLVPSISEESLKDGPEVPVQSPRTEVPFQAKVQVNQTLLVQKIRVNGSTFLPPKVLEAMCKPYEKRKLTLEELDKLIATLNHGYWDKGYATTQAYLPPQEVENGVLEIQVQEGRVGQLRIKGNRFYHKSLLLNETGLSSGQLLNLKALQDNINRANQNNNNRFVLKASLAAGKESGETDVELRVAEKQPWQITPSFDNQGRPYIGINHVGLQLTNESLLGFGDTLTTQLVAGTGTQGLNTSYFVPINKRGDQLGASFGMSAINVELGIPVQPEIKGYSKNYGLTLQHPFDREHHWLGDIGVQRRNVESYFAGFLTNQNQVQTVQAGITFNKSDKLGRTYARLQGSLGEDLLVADSGFKKAEAVLVRLFRLGDGNTLMLRGYGQFSPNAVPTVESFQVGGAYSVRGYTQGLLFGDSGYSLTLEDQFRLPMLNKVSPWLANRLQGAVFFDMGQSLLNKRNARYYPEINGTSTSLLMGTGVGLRFQLTRLVQGFVDIGFGLGNKDLLTYPLKNPVARLHFGLRSNLLSESFRSSPPPSKKKPRGASLVRRSGIQETEVSEGK